MLDYEPEKVPQMLKQGPKMLINLSQLSDDHWNIASDLILPLAIDAFKKQCEAKWTAPGLAKESEGIKASPMEASAPGRPPCVEARTSAEMLPKSTALPKEQVLKTTQEILERVHMLCTQAMREMVGALELDRTQARTLLAESARAQLIVGEDLARSLITLHTDL